MLASWQALHRNKNEALVRELSAYSQAKSVLIRRSDPVHEVHLLQRVLPEINKVTRI